MFDHAKASTFQCRFCVGIKCAKEDEFEDSLSDLCSCFHEKNSIEKDFTIHHQQMPN